MVPFPLYCTNCGVPNQAQAKFCLGCGQSLQGVMPLSSISSSTGLLLANHLLKERYCIRSHAGKGGFAAVYKAEDTLFGNRLVAVKEMSQSGLSQQEIVQASRDFRREALLLASLSHQNLPRILDHFHDSGRWYLVIDFIEGETLDKYLNNAGIPGLTVDEVLNIGIQLCIVLEYLHTRQPPIIFRDLKPSNVMLAPDGHLYLIDFGIARHFKPGQARDTIAFGSPGYAAPEQYGKAQTTPQADIYSLGATLHHLFSGNDPSQTPFQFAPLQLHSSPVSAELEHLIRQMVELDINKRPTSMKAVNKELQRLATREKAWKISTLQSRLSSNVTSLTGVSQASQHPIQQLQTAEVLPSATTPYTDCIYRGHAAFVATVAWSPDGQFIASAGFNETVHIWETVQVFNILIYYGHAGPVGGAVYALAWSAHGKYIASASSDHTVQVWDHITGLNICTYRGHAGWFHRVRALAWSPDCRYIASASVDKTVQVWEATTGHHIFTYEKHNDWVRSVTWSADGQFIASGSADKTVQVWNISLLQKNSLQHKSLTYAGHSGEVTTVDWSPGGQYIASGSSDMTVHVWFAATGDHIFTYKGHADIVNTVAWSPDGKHIASGSADGVVHVWRAPSTPSESD